MRENFINIANKFVCVAYVIDTNSVVVSNQATGKLQVFGGWEDIKWEFDLFLTSFSADITYQEALDYFKPNIAQKLIVK